MTDPIPPEIARLKNTGLTEKKILDQIKSGLTDAQADREIAALREFYAQARAGSRHWFRSPRSTA